MSYQTERQAIERYFAANWSATPIGYDGHSFEPTADSIRLTIQSGMAMQKSFGRPGANKIEHIGLLQINVYVAYQTGSQAWRGYVEDLQNLLINQNIDANGNAGAGGSDVVVQFGRRGLQPYVSSVQNEPPLTQATVNAPFVRDEEKG